MKSKVLVIFILLAAGLALPQISVAKAFAPGSATLLFHDAVATGTGTVELDVPISKDDHVYQVTFTDANSSISALKVCLEGSLDGANWFVLGTEATLSADQLAAFGALIYVVDKPVNYIRGKITTLTGGDGTTDTIDIRYDLGG